MVSRTLRERLSEISTLNRVLLRGVDRHPPEDTDRELVRVTAPLGQAAARNALSARVAAALRPDADALEPSEYLTSVRNRSTPTPPPPAPTVDPTFAFGRNSTSDASVQSSLPRGRGRSYHTSGQLARLMRY